MSEKASLKRKASNSQLSPPPTPDAMRGDKPKTNAAAAAVVVVATQPLKKKRMVKQVKPYASQALPMQQTLDLSPLLESSWSPVGHTPPTYFDVTSTSPTYTNTTSPLSLFTATTGGDLYPQQPPVLSTQPHQFQNMIHPMLFAPYYMPSEVAGSPNDCKYY